MYISEKYKMQFFEKSVLSLWHLQKHKAIKHK